jgi:hypothetical protein
MTTDCPAAINRNTFASMLLHPCIPVGRVRFGLRLPLGPERVMTEPRSPARFIIVPFALQLARAGIRASRRCRANLSRHLHPSSNGIQEQPEARPRGRKATWLRVLRTVSAPYPVYLHHSINPTTALAPLSSHSACLSSSMSSLFCAMISLDVRHRLCSTPAVSTSSS